MDGMNNLLKNFNPRMSMLELSNGQSVFGVFDPASRKITGDTVCYVVHRGSGNPPPELSCGAPTKICTLPKSGTTVFPDGWGVIEVKEYTEESVLRGAQLLVDAIADAMQAARLQMKK